jgi:hypothetical protein
MIEELERDYEIHLKVEKQPKKPVAGTLTGKSLMFF